MKRNSFYLLVGLVALLEVVAFWVSVELEIPQLIQVAFILGILLIYGARRMVEGRIEDERISMITQKAALRTLEIFWVVFFAVNLGSAVIAFSRPLGLRPRPPHPGETELLLPGIGWFATVQMALLCLMIFLYVGFRMYYARKYGEWDADEEQD
ncbi:hypothetical protein ABH15_02635 [Methanoculleus taiwanensis]|uniref:DUF2178 domain-containing protein n=1 Tax=Methanoculleus taiwanensis TaxID=1550565 RepID=A0A498H5N8_9EURY|nr:DUF2178 domain-containing protein [Methanoculleus taiwanensis]RXE57046.1 hypothetical protein ABH15_02635 [Methanoculleus taiwanensis]